MYSYGILVWFVAQYLHLCYNPHIWCNRKDFTDMMRPYSKGTRWAVFCSDLSVCLCMCLSVLVCACVCWYALVCACAFTITSPQP